MNAALTNETNNTTDQTKVYYVAGSGGTASTWNKKVNLTQQGEGWTTITPADTTVGGIKVSDFTGTVSKTNKVATVTYNGTTVSVSIGTN